MPRLRRSVPRRRIRPLLMWHPRQRAESFRASSPTSGYGARSKTPHQHTQSLTHLRGRTKRPPVRPPKRRDQASKSPRRNPGFSSDENAPLAESASTRSHQTASAQSVDGGVSPRALSAKAKRKDKITISRDNVREKHLPNDQRSPLGTDSPATLSSIVDDRPPQSSKANHHSSLRLRRCTETGRTMEAAVAHDAMKLRRAVSQDIGCLEGRDGRL